MTGNYSGSCRTSTSCWQPRSGTYAAHAAWDADRNGTGYIDYDTGAWNYLRNAYASGSTLAWWLSCVDGRYTPCSISVSTSSAKNYTCQSNSGSCTGGTGSSATRPRGGQCKAFANLVLYRSGQYRYPSSVSTTTGNFKTTPSYSTSGGYAIVTTGSIAIGDLLARTTSGSQHSMIVVAYDNSADGGTALVVDSNYIGGDGNEYIGQHTASFNGSSYSDLDNYHDLDCIYSGSC